MSSRRARSREGEAGPTSSSPSLRDVDGGTEAGAPCHAGDHARRRARSCGRDCAPFGRAAASNCTAPSRRPEHKSRDALFPSFDRSGPLACGAPPLSGTQADRALREPQRRSEEGRRVCAGSGLSPHLLQLRLYLAHAERNLITQSQAVRSTISLSRRLPARSLPLLEEPALLSLLFSSLSFRRLLFNPCSVERPPSRRSTFLHLTLPLIARLSHGFDGLPASRLLRRRPRGAL